MYDPAAELMLTLAAGAEADETFAANFVRLAGLAETNGQTEIADTFYSQARLHRAKAIELRARLGALVEEYGPPASR